MKLSRYEYSLDITDRKRAEEAPRKSHDELEMRVKERTAELTKTNEELRNEILKRKRVEEQIIEARVEAEAANVPQTRFLQTMSHELRTPQ